MSTKMEEDVKRWTTKRKAGLVMGIMQGKTTVAAASRSFGLASSEIETWVGDAKKGMDNALRTKPLEINRWLISPLFLWLKGVRLGRLVVKTQQTFLI